MDGQLYDFDTPVTADLVLTAKWREITPTEGPDVSSVMLRVRDVNEKHATAHGAADYRFQLTDGTSQGPVNVNSVWIYTFTVTNTEKFLDRYNAEQVNGASRGTHRLVSTEGLTVTWTWDKNGWVCQNPDLGLENGATTSAAPVAVMLDAEYPFTVTFENNGTTFAAQEVYSGGTAARPDNDPTNPDSSLKFAGWYKENKKYDFSTPVTDDLTLTAHWTRRSGGGSTRYTVTVAETENGSTAATFSPDVICSRSHIVTFLYRQYSQ